jgi:hypothetical protein
VKDGFGQPDLVIRSSEYTMPAQHQDVWYRPEQVLPITEAKWVKLVEIRPTNLKARKILTTRSPITSSTRTTSKP